MAEAARDNKRGRKAAGGFDCLPVTIEHAASRRAAAVGALLLPPVVAVMLAPALVLFSSPAQALSSALGNPFAATHAAVGIALWTGLIVVPAQRLLQRLGVCVAVHIDDAGALLGLPTIPAAQLYRFGAPLPTTPTAPAPLRVA